jgi:hypothetical protein
VTINRKEVRRVVQIPCRYTEAEAAELREKAALRGMKVAAYIRWLFARDVQRKEAPARG